MCYVLTNSLFLYPLYKNNELVNILKVGNNTYFKMPKITIIDLKNNIESKLKTIKW